MTAPHVTRRPLDAPTQALLAAFAEARGTPIDQMTPAEAREAGSRGWAPLGTGPQMYEVTEHSVAPGGHVRVRVLRPAERPCAVLVYLHGGGWVLGDIDGYDQLGRILAERSGATVVLVNYRKAPEHPFPGPVDDVSAALDWVQARRGRLAAPDAPLVVAGDSAGGNLAVVAALRARDRGGPVIDKLLLAYPITDCDTSRPSYLDPDNQLLLGAETMGWFFDHYVGAGDRADPEVSPLRAELAGLPDTLLLLAVHDPLYDEGVAFAERLRAAGVGVEVSTYADQLHGFVALVGLLPASDRALDELAGAVSRAGRS